MKLHGLWKRYTKQYTDRPPPPIMTDIPEFITYYTRIRQRTMRVMDCIPPASLEWAYMPGAFSCGDLIRHIAAIERFVYIESVAGRPPRYPGCSPLLASGKEEVIQYMNTLHHESIAILQGLGPDAHTQECCTPEGHPITVWKWLRALVEHEIHHRGQIYMYLRMLGVKTPPIFGLTSEELLHLSMTR